MQQSTERYIPPPPAVVAKTNGFAVASLVLGIVWVFYLGSVLAIIFGHVALSQMKKDPRMGGRGLAIAGLVLGYIGVGFLVVAIAATSSSSSY